MYMRKPERIQEIWKSTQVAMLPYIIRINKKEGMQ